MKIRIKAGTLMLLLLTISLFCVFSCSSSVEGRSPYPLEDAYMALAQDLQSPSFCEKIFPKSYRSYGLNPTGYQISYLQSDCLQNLARQTKNPYYCKNVKSISTLFLDGNKISDEECLKLVNAEPVRTDKTSYSFDLTLLMTTLGYTESIWSDQLNMDFKEFLKEGINREEAIRLTWQDFYFKNLHSNDFKNRLEKLPAFTE